MSFGPKASAIPPDNINTTHEEKKEKRINKEPETPGEEGNKQRGPGTRQQQKTNREEKKIISPLHELFSTWFFLLFRNIRFLAVRRSTMFAFHEFHN